MESSLAPILHSVEWCGNDPGARREEAMVHKDRDPGESESAGGFLSAQYLVPRVYVCARARGRFGFCFSVSTGEPSYGDVCDTFVHVKKAFSSFRRARGGQRASTLLSLCPEKAIIFPNGSPIMLLFMQTGYYTGGKGF